MREIARILALLLSLYNILIIIRIFSMWLRPFRNMSGGGGIMDFIAKVTDPFLQFFRRAKFMQFGQFDFSVLLAFMSISIIQNLLSVFSATGKMSLGYALATILQSLWLSIGSLLLGIIIVLLIVRLVLAYKKTPNSIQYITMLNQWLGKVLDTVHSFVFGGKEISDRTLLFTSLGLCVGTYFILMQLVRLGVEFLYKLPI